MSQHIEFPEIQQIPKCIRPTSSNSDVQLFLFGTVLKYNYNLSLKAGWDMVKHFVGDGQGAFAVSKERWIEEFGEQYGPLLYARMEQERKDSEKDVPNDADTVWPYIRSFGALLTVANASTAVFEGVKTHKLEFTKPFAIATASYGAISGFLYIVSSSQKYSNSKSIPKFFKVQPRPPGRDVWWWPSTKAGNE